MSNDIDYKAAYDAALNSEAAKHAYIDLMKPEDLRAEMRALISMLEAERRMTRELQRRLGELVAGALFPPEYLR